eukprot:gene56092-29793_t
MAGAQAFAVLLSALLGFVIVTRRLPLHVMETMMIACLPCIWACDWGQASLG